MESNPERSIVDVAVPYRVPSSFHYLIEPSLAEGISLGSVIQVPFRSGSTHAFVLGFPEKTGIAKTRLKTIEAVVLSEPVFDETMLKFLRWVSDYYCHPLGEVIATALPRPYWQPPKRKRKEKAGAAPDSLKQLGVIGGAPSEKPDLNAEQKAALDRLLDPSDLRPALLHGVTGSGKTEVYMHVLEQALKKGKGGIVLVPEIALTPQLLGRFSARFPGLVAVLHSDLTARERNAQWERLRSGQARIVVGARSAVFAPVKNLGLIVVDEEHESSFKQEDSVRYHGRDVAVVRGHFFGAKVLLGSATPSLESYHNARSGKFAYVVLSKRVQDRPMPKTFFVDLKDEEESFHPQFEGIRPGTKDAKQFAWLSRTLVEKMRRTLKAGQQTMLFLNRLGFAHFLFCHDCGHTWRCNACDVALTYYRHPPQLKCHYCGANKTPPQICEDCQGTALEAMGVGTEQVENQLRQIFPEARIARMDRSVVKTRGDLENVLNQISRHEIDIVIGTQMIAKGHDFPGIALVGILVADASLNLPDFRAHERTYQIITQVSGRAGRAKAPGEVVIQTLNPEHPVLRAAAEHRGDDFYRLELEAREQFGFPPFSRMAMLRFQHRNLKRVEAMAHEISSVLSREIQAHGRKASIIGPSEAPLSKLKNLYRWQSMLKCESVKDMQELVKGALAYATKRKTSVQLHIDVDPINSL